MGTSQDSIKDSSNDFSQRVIVYIASSLDGYIAKPGDNLDFLSIVDQEGQDYGYGDFMKSVGAVIQGRRTYDWIIKAVGQYPHADKEAYVITRKEQASIGQTHFYTGPLEALVERLKKGPGHIFVDGGAQIVNLMLKLDLVDEIILSIVPVLLGSGIRLFEEGLVEQKLGLVSTRSFESGLVQLHYTTRRS